MSDTERRREAADRYRPDQLKVLLVAESPPRAPERYFFFPDVRRYDFLFREVYRGVTGKEPRREGKADQLVEVQCAGVWLIDLKEDPSDPRPFGQLVSQLVERVRQLQPRCVILIKVNVYDLTYRALAAAGLPVIPIRMPFPAAGRQREFREAFKRALTQCRALR